MLEDYSLTVVDVAVPFTRNYLSLFTHGPNIYEETLP